MDMEKYLDIFIEETKDHLQGMNSSLLKLEKNPGDTAQINEIFRIIHTIKGMSGTMGYNRISKLTHAMEDILDDLRNGKMIIDTEMVDMLFKGFDVLEEHVDSIVETGKEKADAGMELQQDLRQMILRKSPDKKKTTKRSNGGIEKTVDRYDTGVMEKAAQMGKSIYAVDIRLDKGCVLKSARAFLIFKKLEQDGEILKSRPAVEEIEDENFEFEFSVIIVTGRKPEELKKSIESVSEVESVNIRLIEKPGSEFAPGSEKYSAGEVQARHRKTGKTVRIDIERLDILLNLVSELIIQKTRLEELGSEQRSQAFNETIEYLERVTTNLHDAVMKVRMVPVESVFNRFPRMIRDLSRELGKKIELEMSGEETELDRTVIDEIGDPIIHILRNCADHGIENSQERLRKGKPEEGKISLKAYQYGNNVNIEVCDDGRGLNLEKVRSTAVEKGMLKKQQADSLSMEETIELMFTPNFSTAQKVTGLSGRGVGLDVVKTKIEALGGSINVETGQGKGSRFIISLPLTLAMIQALLVRVGNEKYAIPQGSISRIIRITPEDIERVHDRDVISIHNSVIPIMRLADLLNAAADEEEQKKLKVVVVKKGEKLTAIQVDDIIAQQEIVIKSLGRYLSGISGLSGATILGDGNVALILDVNSLV